MTPPRHAQVEIEPRSLVLMWSAVCCPASDHFRHEVSPTTQMKESPSQYTTFKKRNNEHEKKRDIIELNKTTRRGINLYWNL